MKLKILVAALAAVGSVGMIGTANAVPPQCLDSDATVWFPTTTCTVNSAQGCQDPAGGCSCEGSAGDDIIVGSNEHHVKDVIISLGGNDIIVSQQGNDLVCSGAGEDFVDAGNAGRHHYYRGDDGKDYRRIPNNQVRLGSEDDVVVSDGDIWGVGGDGNDTMIGGDNEDYFMGGAGKDFLTGGEDDDHLRGGVDNDFLSGQEGEDLLDGSAGKDTCVGGEDGDSAINCEVRVAI